MVRVQLLGVSLLVRDEDIAAAIKPFLEPDADSDPRDVAPVRHMILCKVGEMEKAVPGLIDAIMAEQRVLNNLGLPAEEVVVWENKVRANPGKHYMDPRNPDEYTRIL